MPPFRHWLSSLFPSLYRRCIHKSDSRRRRNRVAADCEVLESRLLLAAASLSKFTGADPGEGLDFDGNFVYAIDYAGQSGVVTQVRDAAFTADNVAGATINAPGVIRSFVSPNYGAGTADRNLAEVMSSIRHGAPNGDMRINLSGVVTGASYKLQLLFADSSTSRGFDVKVEGTAIAPGFAPSSIHGAGQQNVAGTVLTYEFIASDDTVNIELNGSTTAFVDKNSIINGLTLEDLRPKVTLGSTVSLSEGFSFGSTIDGFGQALSLDNGTATRRADFGTNLQLSTTGAYTQEFLLYPQVAATGELFTWGTSVSNLATVKTFNSGRGLLIGGPAGEQVVDNILNPDAWNQIAQTYDGTQMQLYVNGVLVQTTARAIGTAFTEPTRITLGRQAAAFDELRVWNVVRTQAEIQKSMFVPLNGDERGLVGYWSFNGNLQDRTGKAAGFSDSATPVTYLNNPQPQVGWVDVIVDSPVTAATGLFVAYTITGGTALENVDFLSSRFRTLSSDPASERLGIIIPQGETRGRIYFLACPDAVAELTETVSIELVPFTFSASTYAIGTSKTTTINITDNGAYKPGVGMFDADGRSILPDATGVTPLYVDPVTGFADIDIALTSQPTSSVQLTLTSGVGVFRVGNSSVSTLTLTFTPENWDTRQRIRLATSLAGIAKSQVTVSQVGSTSYLSVPAKFAYTTVPPQTGEVGEGNSQDGASIVPTVQLVAVRDAIEGNSQGGTFRLNLDTPAPAGGLDVAYTYSLNEVTTVGAFSGGDLGEGLDLDGNFVYAVNMRGPAVGPVRDVNFTADNVAGLTFNAPNEILNYITPDYGATANDDNLETVMRSIRWAANPNQLSFRLNNLVPGTEYKLQLLFAEAGSDRGFDIYADSGTDHKIVDDFNVQRIQGGATNRKQGAVVTYQFVAQKSTLDIRLDGTATPFPDKNPILNGLTLEKLPGLTDGPLSGVIHVPVGAVTADLGIVIPDNSVDGPESRTLTIALVDNPAKYLRADGQERASVRILDDDQARILVSNFAENPLLTPGSEPNDTAATANQLGLIGSGVKINGGISTATDNDFYHFTVDKTRNPLDEVQLTTPAASNLVLQVFRPNGLPPLTLHLGGGTTTGLALVNGEYTLRVYGASGATSNYELNFFRNDKLAEPNNSIPTATDLGVVDTGVVARSTLRLDVTEPVNDVDIYKFTLDDRVADVASVVVSTLATQPLSLLLYNSAGTLIDSTSQMQTSGTQSTLTLGLGTAIQRGNGTYYLQVAPQSPANRWNYNVEFKGQSFTRSEGLYTETYSSVVVEESAAAPDSKRFGLRLATQPAAPVTLRLTTTSSGLTDAATLSTTSLTFTPTNWDLYQAVTVTAIDDLLLDGDQTLSITATATSSDPSYNNKILKFEALVLDNEEPAQPAVVTQNQDPNLPQLFVTGLGGSVAESPTGSTINVNIALSKPVAKDTYVGFALDEGTATLGVDFSVANNLVRDYRNADAGITGITVTAGATVPAFADIDGDGDLDLFVGAATGALQFYRNVGTRTAPRFELQTGVNNPLNGLGTESLGGNLHPAFSDADGDGDLDLLLGSRTQLTYFRNEGTARVPQFRSVAASISPFSATSALAGTYFAPTFADVDGDGDQDLFIPSQGSSTATYFEKTGNNTFTRSDAKNPASQLGFSTTDTPTLSFADLDADGDLDALIGLSSGTFAKLNEGDATHPNIGLVGLSRFGSVVSELRDPAWVAADLDGDSVPEEIAGDSLGRLRVYSAYRALVIPAGSTRATLQLRTIDDVIDEVNETIGLRVLESRDYRLTTSQNVVDTYDADQDGNTGEFLPGSFAGVLTIIDNDQAAFITEAFDTTITENGKSVPLKVKLASQPLSNVVVYVGSSDATEGLISVAGASGVATATLTFTPANWNVFQTVSIVRVEDLVDDGDRPFRIVLSSTSDDVPYRQLSGTPLTFVNTDNDTVGIVVTGPQSTVDAASNIIGVQLTTQPIGEVQVTVTPENSQIRIGNAGAGVPVTLRFNPQNWNLRQLVQVTAVDDGFVEYTHNSSVRFSIQTGRTIDGPTLADISQPQRAYDLGDITGGINWTNFPFDRTLQSGAWFQFQLAEMGGTLDKVRALAPDFDTAYAAGLALFDTAGNPIKDSTGKPLTGVLVPETRVSGVVVSPAYTELPLNGLADGTYLLRVVGQVSTPRGFTLAFDGADRQFEKLALASVAFSIADNDVPTASLIAGPSASEVSSTPSYFAVKLNAPAADDPGNAGIRVNFQITGGTATFGTAASTLHDYSIAADFFDPVTRTGWVRVAPGDVQANIGVIPVDDKLVEDLPFTLREFQFNPTVGYAVRIAVESALGDSMNVGNTIRLAQGTTIKARISSSRELTFVVRSDITLQRGVYGTPTGGSRVEYAALVPVDATESDRVAAMSKGATAEYPGRVQSEDVQIRILPGAGYSLPLAPDKQNLDARDPAVQAVISNFDPARIAASMTIVDDDVPGIQFIRLGDDGNLAEGETAQYGVALASEPRENVTVTLTPDGQFVFVNPTSVGAATVSTNVYKLQPTNIPSNLELRLDSLVKTDLGWTAAFDARLRQVAFDGVDVTLNVVDTADANRVGDDQVTFDVPGVGEVDAAGRPVIGNWNAFQHLVVSNLTPRSNNGDYFEVKLNLGGVERVLRIDVTAGPNRPADTKQLTFTPSNWFVFQTVEVRALTNSVAEPGDWHEGRVSVALASNDPTWNGASVPNSVIRLADQQLQGGQTAQALTTGFDVLRDSLDSVQLPLVGNLLDFAPQVGQFFDAALTPLVTALKSQSNLSVTELQKISQSALTGATAGSSGRSAFSATAGGGFLDVFTVSPEATADQVTLHLTMEKTWHLFDLDLSSDIGLEALGLQLQTEGSLTADVTFKLEFVLGLHRQFGFFIDTEATGLDVDASVALDGFQGTGGLGFLKLDFNDDPNNPSELGVHFHAGLNDLDNYQSVQFFDVDGDGLLGTGPFTYGIGADNVAPRDGRLDDVNGDGHPDLVAKVIAEPYMNVNAQGVPVDQTGRAADFPTVSSLNGTSGLSNSSNVNWNGNNTFDEAVSITKEGVYRSRTLNGVTIFYFDANNNGQLDIGKRNVNPFTSSWNLLSETQKNSSEMWVKATTRRWVTAQNSVNPFQIQSQGSGATLAYYFDSDGNNFMDADEKISNSLRTKLDKNKNGILEANIQQDGEGQYVQGTGIAFADANNNGQLDYGEKFVNSGFGETSFADVPDGNYAGKTVPFTVQGKGTGTVFIDLNSNGFDAVDPQAIEGQTITVPEKTLAGVSLFVTAPIVKEAGTNKRFFDLNNNGVRDVPPAGTPIKELYLDDIDPALQKSAAQQFQITPWQTSFTFYDTNADQRLGIRDFAVLTSGAQRYLDLDFDGKLTQAEDGTPLEPFAVQNNTFDTSSLPAGVKVVQLLNDGDRLTLKELLNFSRQVRSQSAQRSQQLADSLELFNYSFAGEANLGLHAVTSIDGNAAFPSFSFDLAVNFPLFNLGDEAAAASTGFTVDFNHVTMELGTFLQDFVSPIIDTVDELLTPIKPIVQVLNADTKLLSAIGLDGAFESDGRPGVSLLEIAKKLAGGQDPRIDAAIKFADVLTTIVDTVDTLHSTLSAGDNAVIEFGDFSLSDLRAASDDIANSAGHARDTSRTDGQGTTHARTRAANGTTSTLTQATGQAAQNAMVASTQAKSNIFKKLGELEGFEFKLFNPDTVMSLLMGEPAVDIVTYDVPDFAFDFSVSHQFPIWGPLQGLLEGGFKVSTDLSIGFDTAGIDKWKEDGFDPSKAYEVFDGFYLNDWSPSGVDKNELSVEAFVAAGAGLNLGIVSGFVRGGVRGTIGLDLVDAGERNGESDGKIRGSDIVSAFSSNPLELFELNGLIEAFLGARVDVDFFFFSETVWEEEFATFKLAQFTLDASGFSGSSDFGRAQAGPISGGFVWLDANNNEQFDAIEPWTITDTDGNYALEIPDGYDRGSGIVRIRGGVDATTGIPQTVTLSKHLGEELLTPFTTLAEQVAVTPIDSSVIDFDANGAIDDRDSDHFYQLYDVQDVAADIYRDGVVDRHDAELFEVFFEISLHGGTPTLQEADQLILLAAGLDPNIDLSRLAHLDATLGNDPAARNVLIQVDSYEGLVVGLKAWLAGAAGVPNDDPFTEAILTDAIDRAVARQIVKGRVDLTDFITVLAIVQDAVTFASDALAAAGLSASLNPISLAPRSAGVAEVLIADTRLMQMLSSQATNAIELAALVTKVKLSDQSTRSTDLYQFGQGLLSEDDLLTRDARFDEEELNRIRLLPLPPYITRIADFHIQEDQVVTEAHISAFDLDTPRNFLQVSIDSDNPDLLPASQVSLTPQSDFYDWTLDFVPAANASGHANITLTFIDEAGLHTSRTFGVTVNPVNDAPLAQDDVVDALSGISVSFDPRGNDIDIEGDHLSATLVTPPRHGKLVENLDGTFTYLADLGFSGLDAASYAVSDGHDRVAVATITFHVAPTVTSIQAVTTPRNTTISALDFTFSEPMDLSTLDFSDLTLTRNGGLNLLTPAQTISQLSPTKFRITGLAQLTRPDGDYVLTVNAAGVRSVTGNAGGGAMTRSWTTDGSPYITSISTFTPRTRETSVDEIEVAFSETLDPGSFDWTDLKLTRNGGQNLLTGAETIRLDDGKYYISGLSQLTSVTGRYVLTVDATGVRDLTGHVGIGSQKTTWVLRQVPPKVLAFSQQPSSLTNHPVANIDVTFSEPIDPTTLDINDLQLTRDQVVLNLAGAATITHLTGNTWRLGGLTGLTNVGGRYSLTVNTAGVRDTQGVAGVKSSSVSWVEDLTAPTIVTISTPVPSTRNTPVASLNVKFSEKLDLATFQINDLTLTRNGGPNLLTGSETIAFLGGTTYQIGGLTDLTAEDGAYLLTMDATTVSDLAGNSGVGTMAASWSVDTLAPTSKVLPLASATAASLSIQLSISGSDPVPTNGAIPSGIKAYSIYVATDSGPFVLWKTVSAPADSTLAKTTFLAESDHSYSFYSVAIDKAGNTEQKVSGVAEASVTVNDLSPPRTEVTAVDSSKSVFVISAEGFDIGSNGVVSAFDLYVSIDGNFASRVATMPGGVADADGVYHVQFE